MKSKKIVIFITIIMMMLIPISIFAINTDITIGGDLDGDGSLENDPISSSIEMTERIVGVLQVAGTIIAIISLIIIGMRYMFSSIQERAQLKGLIPYWIVGAILVFATSNVLAFVYDIVRDVPHSYGETYTALEPTCVSEGRDERKCTGENGFCNCKEDNPHILEIVTPINPDAHNMGQWGVEENETCTEDGLESRICLNGCGKKETRIRAKLGHNYEYKTIRSATCTAHGYEGNKCKRCGHEKDTTTIAATGHNYTNEVASSTYLKDSATCTSKATYYKSCTACGEKGTTIFSSGDLAQHNFTKEDTDSKYLASAATCTSKATYHHSCTACGAEGTTTFESGTTIAHKFSRRDTDSKYLASAATCLERAKYYKCCSVCGTKGEATFSSGKKASHNFTKEDTDSKYLASPATCTTKATYNYSCTVCGEKGTVEFENGDFLPHDYSEENDTSDGNKASPATCVAKARYYKKCKCGATGTDTFESGNFSSVHIAENPEYTYTPMSEPTPDRHRVTVTWTCCGRSGSGQQTCDYDKSTEKEIKNGCDVTGYQYTCKYCKDTTIQKEKMK